MRVVSNARLRQFWGLTGHQDAGGPLRAWHTHVNSKTVSWRSWGDVRVSFGGARLVGDCTVFNVGGNKYRLISRIRYAVQKVFVLKVITRGEYDAGAWKGECGCFGAPPPRKPAPSKRPTSGRRS